MRGRQQRILDPNRVQCKPATLAQKYAVMFVTGRQRGLWQGTRCNCEREFTEFAGGDLVVEEQMLNMGICYGVTGTAARLA